MEYLGELGSTIGAGETRVLQAADIGQALGIDSWAGRFVLRCTVVLSQSLGAGAGPAGSNTTTPTLLSNAAISIVRGELAVPIPVLTTRAFCIGLHG